MLNLGTLYLTILLVSIVVYYSAGIKYRPLVLFVASIVFVLVLSVKALLFALILSVLNFYYGLLLQRVRNKSQNIKVILFWVMILTDIGILIFAKLGGSYVAENIPHYSFTIIDANPVYGFLLIPLGISYYSFQVLGYLIRINRGVERAERNFIKFTTYLIFFPKFLAGPVLRSNHFLPQIDQPVGFNRDNIYEGGRLFLWGIFKKLAIADQLKNTVLLAYVGLHDYSGVTLIFILLIQTMYIYFDFSGYSDIAIGAARLFGIKIIDNFNRPFFSRSVTEYWRRWHISLSSWTNDFIYNPFIIKFRKFENAAVVSGIFVTFFIVGIWHGLNWTFVILGILQGIAIVYEYYTKKYRHTIASKLHLSFVKSISRILVYLFISISLIFFFSANLNDAFYFLTHLFSSGNNDLNAISGLISDKGKFTLAFLFIIALLSIEAFTENGKNVLGVFLKLPLWIQSIGIIVMTVIIIFQFSGIESFYYMRF